MVDSNTTERRLEALRETVASDGTISDVLTKLGIAGDEEYTKKQKQLLNVFFSNYRAQLRAQAQLVIAQKEKAGQSFTNEQKADAIAKIVERLCPTLKRRDRGPVKTEESKIKDAVMTEFEALFGDTLNAE